MKLPSIFKKRTNVTPPSSPLNSINNTNNANTLAPPLNNTNNNTNNTNINTPASPPNSNNNTNNTNNTPPSSPPLLKDITFVSTDFEDALENWFEQIISKEDQKFLEVGISKGIFLESFSPIIMELERHLAQCEPQIKHIENETSLIEFRNYISSISVQFGEKATGLSLFNNNDQLTNFSNEAIGRLQTEFENRKGLSSENVGATFIVSFGGTVDLYAIGLLAILNKEKEHVNKLMTQIHKRFSQLRKLILNNYYKYIITPTNSLLAILGAPFKDLKTINDGIDSLNVNFGTFRKSAIVNYSPIVVV